MQSQPVNYFCTPCTIDYWLLPTCYVLLTTCCLHFLTIYYSLLPQVLMVNLLIAMMTETYQKIKMNADDEWKFRRVFIVDEFMGTVFHWPAPLSLPLLMWRLAQGVGGRWTKFKRGNVQTTTRLNSC